MWRQFAEQQADLGVLRAGEGPGCRLGIASCLVSMIGTGPHKLLMASVLVFAPLTLLGFALELALPRPPSARHLRATR